MKIRNITQGHAQYGEEINCIKDNYMSVIQQSLSKWFNNEAYLNYDDPIDHQDGYQLTFATQARGRYTIRVFY